MNRIGKLILTATLIIGVSGQLVWQHAHAHQTNAPLSFTRDIQPILQANCVGCHGPNKSQAQLRLDEKMSALTMIQPGNAKASRLLQRVLGEGHEPRMPQGREPLKLQEIELLRRSINEGAIWPDNSQSASNHWAFVAPTRPALPAVKNAAWVKSPIDRFILATLEQNGLTPASAADKATLIRRLSLDLIGLPPKLKEIGKPCPPELLKGQMLAFIKPDAALFGTQFKFSKHGQSGAEMSEAFAHLPKVADELTIIRSMMTEGINHAPAQI